MTSQERVTMLLKREIPDRMGLCEWFWETTLKSSWPTQGYPEDEEPEHYFNFDMVSCNNWIDPSPFPDRKEVLEETEEWEIIKDGYGATLRHFKGKEGVREHIG